MKRPGALAKATAYTDLFTLPEDVRITLIGEHVVSRDREATIVVEDEPGKRERYMKKLLDQFPLLEVYEQGDGPVPHTLFFRVRKKGN